MLNRVRVLLRLGWQRGNLNTVGDQEAAVETETERADEVAVASIAFLVNFAEELRSTGLGERPEVGSKLLWRHTDTSIWPGPSG